MKRLVLVIDDEPAIVRMVKVGLKAAGYEVNSATSGKRGLELARKTQPDIVLLDIVMQPLTGFDVLAQLRRFSKVPVIVFTAKSFVADLALQEGANGYISKPFVLRDLTKAIENTLGSPRA